MSNIQDKVVIIMGASSGIGEATTKNLGVKNLLSPQQLLDLSLKE